MIAYTLLLMAIEDLITLKVNNWWQVLLLCEVLIKQHGNLRLIILSCFLYSGYRLTKLNKNNKIGGADIKIFCCLIILGLSNFLYIVFFASLFGILYSLVSKQKKVAFVPFIWIGYMIVNI